MEVFFTRKYGTCISLICLFPTFNGQLSVDVYSRVLLHVVDWLIDYLRFYVPFKNFSLIWKRHHCQWRPAKLRPMLGAQGLWAGRDLYRATPTVTRDLGFFRSHPKDRPIWSPFTTHERIWRIYFNPDPHGVHVVDIEYKAEAMVKLFQKEIWYINLWKLAKYLLLVYNTCIYIWNICICKYEIIYSISKTVHVLFFFNSTQWSLCFQGNTKAR
jgi:hypothetical protein